MPNVRDCLAAIENTHTEMEECDAQIMALRERLKVLAYRLDTERGQFVTAGKEDPVEYRQVFAEIEERAKSANKLLNLIRNGRRI